MCFYEADRIDEYDQNRKLDEILKTTVLSVSYLPHDFDRFSCQAFIEVECMFNQ